MSNEVGFNQQYLKLKMQYEFLKEQCANQLELYTHLVDVEGPNIKARYMMLVGQYEHQVFELKAEIARWKRRFTLRQAALNRGEKPNLVAIEVELDKEFAEYIEEVKKHIAEIKDASLLYHSAKLTEEESTALRYAYLNAVKRLHPDLNPGLPQAAVELWNQIQEAYANKEWTQVKSLAGLVDNVVNGKTAFEATASGLESLEKGCEALRKRCAEIADKMAKTKSTLPFTYDVLLEDEELVRARQEQLNAQIEALQNCITEYEELWNHGK